MAGPAHAAQRVPAVATGSSDPAGTLDGARSRWRLAGRRLTVRLPRALIAGSTRVVTARAQCGENTVVAQTFDEIYPWATVTRGSARVKASTRTVRIVLARDLASRTNFCELSVAATEGLGSARERAAMTVRPRPKLGCRPGSRERVVHESATIRVTTARAGSDGDRYVSGYRACRLPRGNLRRVERADGGGGAGGSDTTATRFTSTGLWLAWVSTYTPHSELGGVRTATVRRIGLPGGVVSSVDSAPGTVSALAVDGSGVMAWVRQLPAPGTPTLQAQAPGGAAIVLDRVLPIVCIQAPCQGAGPITDVAVRNRTVSWRNAGVARSATLP